MPNNTKLIEEARRARRRADESAAELEHEMQMRAVFAERVRLNQQGQLNDVIAGT
jgi:hypothetical protein